MLNVMQGLTTTEVNVIIRKQIMDNANDDQLVLSSFGVVLEVNRRGKEFYNTMTDIVKERTYVFFTYNTKINQMIPRIWSYVNYKQCFHRNGQ